MRSRFFASTRACCAAALVGIAPLLSAQDLTFTPLEWAYEEDTPDQLPTLRGLETPAVPAEIRTLTEPAYAQVRTILGASGKQRTLTVDSTSPWLEPLARHEIAASEFKPARRGSTPVTAQVQTFLIFNPKSAAIRGPEATPRLVHVVPPEHPPATDRRPATGVVRVEAEIAASGEVISARAVDENVGPEFQHAAAEAVRRWKFAPARAAGQTVAATIRTPVLFSAPLEYALSETQTPPKIRKQRPPVYPFQLLRAGLTGEVLVGFVVSVEGRVREAHIVRSNNPYFDQAALDSVLAWTFEPAMKDNAPVSCRMRVPIVFSTPGGNDRGLYYVPRDRKRLAQLPPALQWDHPPVFKATSFAAYPFEQLQNGVEGEVKVNFIVGPRGRIIKTNVISSPDPAFSRAVEAMLDTFEFTPASKAGQPSLAGLSFTVHFDRAGTTEAPIEKDTLTLVRALTQKPERFAKLSELDAKPRHISRRPPVFPSALSGEATEGSALIEYIIDWRGKVHAPRIISASREEFGYAAVQAVATWKFSSPRKGGKAVDTIVRQPFVFSQKPPAAAE